MAFPDSVVGAHWRTAEEKCERCGKELKRNDRGPSGVGTWQAHHADEDTDNNAYSNCRILCWSCHKPTF